MNYYVLATSGRVLLFFSFVILLPVPIALSQGENYLPFVLAFLLTSAVATTFILVSRKERFELVTEKDAYVSVAMIWLLIPVFGSIPFLFYANPLDAFFESMSGFTTTGMSVLIPELLPKSILFWRSFIQWLGGFGIVVLALIFLPEVSRRQTLFYAEYPGVVLPKIKPKTRDVALTIFQLYLTLTLFEVMLLYLLGLDLFNAVLHSFTTISTGGFSTSSESVAKFGDARIEALIAFFAFVGGMNFALVYAFTNKQLRSLADLEFRVYVAIVAIATLTVAILNLEHYGDFLRSLRFSGFQVVSFVTTTGFTTANVNEWSSSAKMVLLILMLIGGCSGSTAGGLKIVRFVILLKYVVTQTYKLIEPRTVRSIRYGSYALDKGVIEEIVTFFILYAFIFFLFNPASNAHGLRIRSISVPFSFKPRKRRSSLLFLEPCRA